MSDLLEIEQNILVQDSISIGDGEQYLLFLSGGDIYAVESSSVSEIVEYEEPTIVPMVSSYIKGVTNIRGNIMGVVDLLDRLSLGSTSVTTKTSYAIVKKRLDTDNDFSMDIAIMIDEVYEVDYISTADFKDTPEFGAKIDKKFISNMATYKDEYIAVLNIENLLDISELSSLES
ncbi:MAG: chemotaxis protein CheW [Helicobacteraceae bacterium]|nr:chemotaxis protein CheW [Helicobacteraceae bacterium]